jgi:hypothetical protein
MIRSTFDAAISRFVVRCSIRDCVAHVAGRTPDAAHDEAIALGWGTVYGRGARCSEHRNYVAGPRRAVDVLRALIERGQLAGNETARAMLREWEAA